MAKLILVDGTTTTQQPATPPVWTLEELQGFVDGYIEEIRGLGGAVGFCNEEGGLRKMPLNKTASNIFGVPLVGPVLILGDGEEA